MFSLAVYVLLDGFAFLLLGAGIEREAILRVTGLSWEQIESSLPTVADYITNLSYVVGLSLVGFGVMMIATSLSGYRKGEKWAWLLSWYIPVYFLSTGIVTYLEGEHLSLDPLSADILFALFVFSTLMQILGFYWFYPNWKSDSKHLLP